VRTRPVRPLEAVSPFLIECPASGERVELLSFRDPGLGLAVSADGTCHGPDNRGLIRYVDNQKGK